jgi:2-oxoglutarate ferredoxin oxidoreductase subunit gamma
VRGLARTEILICGIGGQGIISAGHMLGLAAAIYEKKNCAFIPHYGPEARGGECQASLIIDTRKIGSLCISSPDILVLMSEPNEKYMKLKKNGILICNSDLVSLKRELENFKVHEIPATSIAKKLGKVVVANAVMLGFLVKITKVVSYASMKKSILERIPKKYAAMNLRAFDIGYNYGG